MERLNDRREVGPTGLSANALRMWGMFLLGASIVSRSIIQNRIFGIGAASGNEILAIMEKDQRMMYLAAIALILQIGEACAASIYTFLMTEGMQKTSDMKKYLLRVAGIAVLSEIPYNLATSGKWIDMSSRNPAIGLLVCMVMLWFYKNYPGFKGTNLLYKAAATFGAYMWCTLLNVSNGVCMMIIGLALWAFRKKPQLRVYVGAMAALICSVISPFFTIAPVVFLLLHFYNGEEGEPNKVLNYLSYPVMLVLIAVVGMVAFP